MTVRLCLGLSSDLVEDIATPAMKNDRIIRSAYAYFLPV